MALSFDPLAAARKLRANGMDEPVANATVEVVQEATGALVTPAYLDARIAEVRAEVRAEVAGLRGEVHRALWIQSGVIIGGVGVIVALVEALG